MDAPQGSGENLAWLRDVMPHARLAFASLCGGALRLLFRPARGDTFKLAALKSAWLLFGCVTCGFYFTPVMMDWWRFPDTYSGAIGALLGFIGLSVAEGVLRAVDTFDIGNILRFFLKKDGSV